VFKAQGFAACDPWERTLPELVDAIGERAVVWGSQYPLPDILNFFPNEAQSIVEDRHLAEEAKRRTLWENAADLFHLTEQNVRHNRRNRPAMHRPLRPRRVLRASGCPCKPVSMSQDDVGCNNRLSRNCSAA